MPTAQGQIECYTLTGQARILSDGRAIYTWDGALPRLLAYYFIEHPLATRSEIFDVFWAHLGIKEATNVFHVTKRKISEKLDYELTTYQNGFYVPSSKIRILYDAREFEQLVEEAAVAPDDVARATWSRAVQLYRHPYLNGWDMLWIVAKREKLRSDYVQALTALGRCHRQPDPQRALGFFLRAVAEAPAREDAHQEIMALYCAFGQLDAAIRQYQTLQQTLKRHCNLTPSPETQALYDRYRSGG